jgi:hypothetical protein
VQTAEVLYDVHDTHATCAVLTGFVNQVEAQAGNTIAQQLNAKLIAVMGLEALELIYAVSKCFSIEDLAQSPRNAPPRQDSHLARLSLALELQAICRVASVTMSMAGR